MEDECPSSPDLDLNSREREWMTPLVYVGLLPTHLD